MGYFDFLSLGSLDLFIGKKMEQIVCWFVGKLHFYHIIVNVVAKDLTIHWRTTKQGLLTTCGRIVVIIVKSEVVHQRSMD